MTHRQPLAPFVFLTLVCLLLTCVVEIPPAYAGSNTVVISEFRVRGPNGGNDEFIELYNASSSPINIGGWKINGSNNTTPTPSISTRLIINTGIILNAGCHFLATNGNSSGYSGSVVGDQGYTTGITDTGGIALLMPDGTVVDQVGLSATSGYKEGTPLTSLGTANQDRGYERGPGGASGNGTDTDNNADDFQLISPSTPQNLSSPCVVVSSGITGVGSATPATLSVGNTTLLTVAVTPGTSPASTGIAVTADLSAFGGSSAASLYDDGTNGDVTAGDNTFSLNFLIPGNASTGPSTISATIKDQQGRSGIATISFTINALELTIPQIQGSGSRSPHEGQTVKTTGVVTAVSGNGFWIQDPLGDGDDTTSDGLFVFRGKPVPALGDNVTVTGKVQEFASTVDPAASPATELSGNPSVIVNSGGNPLPAPITITAADIDPNGGVDQLERLEGMRVHVDTLNVVAPTDGNVSEANATSTSNGVFFGVLPGMPRPFRGPGIELPAQPPAGSPCCVPSWNGAPQRIRVDTKSQPTSSPLEVATGDVVMDLTGPLDFGQHAYTIVTDTKPVAPETKASAVSVPVPDTAKEFTVGAFNMERFFDTTNDPEKSDVVLTATAFANRLNKASLAIRTVMNSPDVLAVEEVENLAALQAIADKLNADSTDDPQYTPYLEEGNDIGGIDVGFLVKASRITVNSITPYGMDTTYVEPDGSMAILNDRPPLVLDATITNEHGDTRFYVIVNHLKALSGVDGPADGPRVREKRRQQAEFLASLIQSLQAGDPAAKIVSVGDYNAFEVNDGYVDMMGTIEGKPTPFEQVVLSSPDLVDPNLTDLETTLPSDQRYSYVNYGTAQTLDHVLVSQGMLGISSRFAYARNDADFPESYRNEADRPERLSDHDMPVAYFKLPLYTWSGFLPPVSNGSTFKTGSTIPLKWTLGPNGELGSIVSLMAAANSDCAGPAEGDPFPLATPGNSTLTFANGLFHINWQTKGLTRGCYSVTVGLNDGRSFTAILQLQ